MLTIHVHKTTEAVMRGRRKKEPYNNCNGVTCHTDEELLLNRAVVTFKLKLRVLKSPHLPLSFLKHHYGPGAIA